MCVRVRVCVCACMCARVCVCVCMRVCVLCVLNEGGYNVFCLICLTCGTGCEILGGISHFASQVSSICDLEVAGDGTSSCSRDSLRTAVHLGLLDQIIGV